MHRTPAAARHVLAATLLLSALLTAAVAADPSSNEPWTYLPAGAVGADAWHAAHPGWDGRGVVIAVLDTGVDHLAPGLGTLSTGGHKFLDARDFTPEGEFEVEEAELEDGLYVHADGPTLAGADALAVPPATGDPLRPVWMGLIRESELLNVDMSDANDDGDTDDVYAFLVWAAERAAVEAALGVGEGLELLASLNDTAAASVARERASEYVWLVAVDTDADGRVDDEDLLRDYHVAWDVFALSSPHDPDSRSLMAWTVNVRESDDWMGRFDAPVVEFHHDSGAHGSHCAGIAAGHDVSGQQGLDGVAPGAWVISCKLGDNRLSGGATRTESMKKSFEHAVDFGERYGLPVVVNMSFGINSVEEDDDAIGGWIDDLLAENPGFYVCTSNGNEGPGLSTSGIPATSRSVLASGAYLSGETALDLYQADLPVNTLFAFSSRGGEAPKPDIVAPGSALSTVPGFVDGSARFNGTSMASPQTAGAVACLLSAALQEGYEVHWGMIKRAVIGGATRVPGLALYEQGGGLVNLEGSWRILQALARSETAHRVLDWEIGTFCPLQADGDAPSAYWRTPGGAPADPERVTFRVRPVFHPDLTPDERDVFFRSFKLKSEASWLKVLSSRRYVRGDMAMSVDLAYDGKKLAAPGVYSARVIATLDGGDLSGVAAREFALWNTVVVGEAADPADGARLVFDGQDLQASTTRRHFVNVPAGATAMRCRLEVSDDTGARDGAGCYLEICNPEGSVKGGWRGYARPETNPITDTVITADELYPGTWEMNIVAAIGNRVDTDYRLSVSFDAYETCPAELTDADGTLKVTRAFPGVFEGAIAATVDGFGDVRDVEVEETDEWSHSFTLDATTPRAEFNMTMDEATANLFTDCAVNIYDGSGHAVRGTGFDGLVCHLSLSKPAGVDEASYTLKVTGGFALNADAESWGFELDERYLFASPVRGEVSRAGGGPLHLHCGVPTELDVAIEPNWPAVPEDLSPVGAVIFRDRNLDDRRPGDDGGEVVLEVPIRLGD